MFRKPKTPETIATEFGWANPSTGELLVSIRGLPNPAPGFVLGRPYVAPTVTEVNKEVKTEVKEVKPESTVKKISPTHRKK